MKSVRWRAMLVLGAIAILGVAYVGRAESGQTSDISNTTAAVATPASSPQPATPVAASQGASVDKDSYTVSVLVPASVSAGKEGVVTVAISVKSGWHLNQEFPTKLEITAPSGVTLKKNKLKRGDATVFSDKKGSFPVVFTAAAAGAKSFAAKLRFAVCTDANCVPKTERLRWAVTVD